MIAPYEEQVTTAMATTVAVRVVGADRDVAQAHIARALEWFERVEACCSRFTPSSELSRLTNVVQAPVPVSAMLFDLLGFALEVAHATDGAFDPTVGGALHARGRDAEWRSGTQAIAPAALDPRATWRDVRLDPAARIVTLERPLLLDLGAVAKGLAVDLAARELADLGDYAIDAGGDLFVAGTNAERLPWRVGIRHPRTPGALLARVAAHDAAVCTSGDYERPLADGRSHIHDPRTAAPTTDVISATVIAPQAMVADALATAAMVLGADAGLALLEAQGVEGLLVTSSLTRHATAGWHSFVAAD